MIFMCGFIKPREQIAETLSDIQKKCIDNLSFDAVVLDWDCNLTIQQLIRADLYLQNPNCLFIACATDMKLPLSKKILGDSKYN